MTKFLPDFFWFGVALVIASSSLHAQEPAKPRKQSAEPKPFGTLTGRIVIEGERPKPKDLEIPASRSDLKGNEFKLDSFEHYRSLGLKDDSLLISADGGLKNVVVWISDKNVPIPPEPLQKRLPMPAQLKFANGQFQPRVLVCESWRILELSNQDKYAINARCLLNTDPFNLLLEPVTGKLSTRQVKLSPEKLPAQVNCDIFPWAKAWLFPVAHPYFAVTTTDGQFRLDRLPLGEWEFRAWHERFGYLKTKPWPKGRFTHKIEDGKQDLGTIAFEIPVDKMP